MKDSRGAFLVVCIVVLLFTLYVKQEAFIARASSALVNNQFGHLISKVSNTDNEKSNSLIFVGDVMLARDVERKILMYGSDYPFLAVTDTLQRSYVVGNFEGSVPTQHVPTQDFKFKFSVDSSNLDTLVNAGFTHLSLANNHSFDYGQESYLNTVHQLELRNFSVAGHPSDISSSSLMYMDVNSIPVAVINISAVFRYPSEEAWRSVVEQANNGSDLQVAYIHWGDEYKSKHNLTQEKFAHALIDSGVDVIVGHHPHVVQDIESYRNGLIIYSLGNFVFDQYFSDEVQSGLLVRMTLAEGVGSLELMPITSKFSKAQPHLMTAESSEIFLNEVAILSSKNIAESVRKGIISFTY